MNYKKSAQILMLLFFLIIFLGIVNATSMNFVGYTKYTNGTNMTSVNVSIQIYLMQEGGPPATIATVMVLSNDTTGFFNISINGTNYNSSYSYKPVLVKYSGGYAQYIGQSLPQFPLDEFSNLGSSPVTFYLKQGVTVDLSAFGLEHGTQNIVRLQNISIPTDYKTSMKNINVSGTQFWAYINNSDCLIVLNSTFAVNRTFCNLNITGIADLAYYNSNYYFVNITYVVRCNLSAGGITCANNYSLTNPQNPNGNYTAVGGIEFVGDDINLFYITGFNDTAHWKDAYNATFQREPDHSLGYGSDYINTPPGKIKYYNGYIYEIMNVSNQYKILRCSVYGNSVCEDTVSFSGDEIVKGLERNPFDGRWYYSSGVYNNFTYISAPYQIEFNIFYQVKDVLLGYPIKETFSNGGTGESSSTFYVPADKNYSLMIYPNSGPAFPGKIDLNNLVEGTNISLGNRNVTVETVSGALYLNLSNVNMTTEFVRLSGYVFYNSSLSEQNYTNITVIAYLIEGGNMVFKGATLPQNMGQWQWPQVNDVFNATTGFYNMTLPASVLGANLMLFANVEKNISGQMTYLGSFRSTTLTYGETPAQLNFTLYPLIGQPTNLTLGFEGQSTPTTILTNLKQFALQDANGTRVSMGHIEIELNYPDTVFPGSTINFSWMADISQNANGAISVPLLNYSVKKINAFTQQYAPLQKPLSLSDMQPNPTNITLSAFNPKGADGSEFGDIMMMMYINQDDGSCSIPYPARSCFPMAEGTDEAEFNPFTLVIGGGKLDFEISKASNNITVRYINVNLLASGPPDAMFDGSSNQTSSGGSLEEAWRFGSQGPEIYDYVLLGVPYDSSAINESSDIRINITKLYDADWGISWQQINGTAALAGTDYIDYNSSTYVSLIDGSGALCNESDVNLTGLCYKDTANDLLWFKIPHFSGIGPKIAGTAMPVAATPAPLDNSHDDDDEGTVGGGIISNTTTIPPTTPTDKSTETSSQQKTNQSGQPGSQTGAGNQTGILGEETKITQSEQQQNNRNLIGFAIVAVAVLGSGIYLLISNRKKD